MTGLPYTPVVAAGPWLLVSGQLGLADGAMVDGGVGAELRQAIANLDAALRAHGATLEHVVKTTVFLCDLEATFDEMNAAYVEAFGTHRPARSALGVVALPRGARVEIEALAYTGR